ncbi:metal ABC transporter substrate-binding protein [Treponema zioleckii]|uniref:metal ABC transporter substrate-binding protein n=1 Tax=Treponema zioleckii TaxID=331680 RepID=UPI00168B7F72|nr:metal ABC transporter substrate-binding protein [Treponema zioleckii]
MIRKILFTLTLIFTLFFSSCTKKNSGTEQAASSEHKTTITASFYPLYIMLMNIADGADVELKMLAPSDTGCLHDYQLTTKDMQAISSSDIVVVNGLGMEDFLDKVFESKSETTIVAGADFETVDDNPHVWVSVEGAIYEVKNICSGLVKLDPKNAEIYEKNSAQYIQKLSELKKIMHDTLEPFSGSTIITFHEAFPYFASEFGLKIASVIEREPGTAPSPKELDEIIQTVNAENSKSGKNVPLFAEPQYSSSSAEVIANETGSKIYELDPCVTGEISKDSYIESMKKNLSVLQDALKN